MWDELPLRACPCVDWCCVPDLVSCPWIAVVDTESSRILDGVASCRATSMTALSRSSMESLASSTIKGVSVSKSPKSKLLSSTARASRKSSSSLTVLKIAGRTYQVVPRDVLESALLVFDTERKWVFDKHNVLQKQHFDYRYMCFDQDFLEMLTLKEEAGMIFWFRPQKSYEKMSSFLTSIEDPANGGKKYQPLILKESKWLTLCGENGWEGKVRHDGRRRDAGIVPKFTRSVARVVSNLKSSSFDYVAVKELLFQSNPTLVFAPL